MLRLLVSCLAIWTSAVSTAHAKDFEITPFIGWRTSDSLEEVNTGTTIKLDETSSYGLLLSMKKDADTNYDFLFSRQNTQLRPASPSGVAESLRLDYYQVGGTIFYDHGKLLPFVSGGLGATHISPANDIYSSETKFSLSIGGGLKVPLTQSLGLRFEVRGYGTAVGSSGAILCSGGCVVKFSGSLFLQFEASAGLSFAF
jgi:opacity protein-like surface antigen